MRNNFQMLVNKFMVNKLQIVRKQNRIRTDHNVTKSFTLNVIKPVTFSRIFNNGHGGEFFVGGCIEKQDRGTVHCHLFIWVLKLLMLGKRRGLLESNHLTILLLDNCGTGKTYMFETITQILNIIGVPLVRTTYKGIAGKLIQTYFH